MSQIHIANLNFTYDGSYDAIFHNVSLRLDTDWKLGLIGRNGRGKTTFLHLLEGRYAHGGTIRASVRFTYFPPGGRRYAADGGRNRKRCQPGA